MGERIDARRIVAATSRFVGIPSHGGRERDLQEILAAELEALGFETGLHDALVGRPNLVAHRGTGGVFLNTHVDTQPPFDHPDPYTCRLEDDLLVGRGVVDTKGQIAALLEAARTTAGPVTIVLTCDEEIGGAGSAGLQLPAELRPEGGGIVLEPTGFRVCSSQAGNIEVRLEAFGSPVHMAEPERGVSAFDVLDGAIADLRAASFMNVSHQQFPAPWLHIAKVSGGEHLWRTPARARAELSMSLLPGLDTAGAAREAARLLQVCVGRARATGGDLHFEFPDVNAPIEVPSDLAVIGRLERAAGRPLSRSGMRSWTDAANLLNVHDLPCVVFGAGELYPAHSDREWVAVPDLVRLADILANLIDGNR